MSKPRGDRQDDLFRPPLEQIIDLRHPLVLLAAEICWALLAQRFGAVSRAAAAIANAARCRTLHPQALHNLSGEELCERWVENPYFQLFCGEVVFRHACPFDRSSLTRLSSAAWRGCARGAFAGKPCGGPERLLRALFVSLLRARRRLYANCSYHIRCCRFVMGAQHGQTRPQEEFLARLAATVFGTENATKLISAARRSAANLPSRGI